MKESLLQTESQICDYELGNHTLTLHYSQNAFFPTTTTNVLFDSIPLQGRETVLDLGTGIGPIAIACAKSGSPWIVGVDVLTEACRMTHINVQHNHVQNQVDIVQGFLLEPLNQCKFDIIVADVSGMAEDVARCSPWYPASIPTGGQDGTDLIIDVLRKCKDYLTPGGCFVFPVITLSRYRKTVEEAEKQFGGRLQLVTEKNIPFHKDLLHNLEALEEMQNKGEIEYYKKGSRYFWKLMIYKAVV